MEFFERLYRGFAAEHYVAGKLFAAGYEAFKLPADFGFDLMVTNQKEQLMGRRRPGRLLEPPFALQVKSRTVTSADFHAGASGRDEAQVSIAIKKEELDLLVGTRNSFLVVVVFVHGDARRFEERAVHFWLCPSHIDALLEQDYFFPDEADRRMRNLTCSVRMFPMLAVEELLGTLVAQHHLTQEGQRLLGAALPQRVPRNWSGRNTSPWRAARGTLPASASGVQYRGSCSTCGTWGRRSGWDT